MSGSLVEAMCSVALLVAALALFHSSLSSSQREFAFRARLFNESFAALASSELGYWSCAGSGGFSSCDGGVLHSATAGAEGGDAFGGGLCVTRTLEGAAGLVFAEACG